MGGREREGREGEGGEVVIHFQKKGSGENEDILAGFSIPCVFRTTVGDRAALSKAAVPSL